MDSQPSGNNELISIESANIIFVLKGERYGISDEAILKINPLDMEFHETDIEHIKIRNKVTPITSKSKNLSGVINLKGDIGATDFIIKVNNKPELEITLEVYTTKISYKEDHKAILREVNEEINNLAYGFLARTYLSSEINNKSNNFNIWILKEIYAINS